LYRNELKAYLKPLESGGGALAANKNEYRRAPMSGAKKKPRISPGL